MIPEFPAPVIVLLKIVLLDHGAHGPVENQDLLFDNIFNLVLQFFNLLIAIF